MTPDSSLAVESLMTRKVACLHPHQSLAAAAAAMATHRVRHLPVVRDGILVGVLSQRDVLAARPGEVDRRRPGAEAVSELELREPVARAMTRRVYTVSPGTPALEVAHALALRRIGCAPVVDEESRLLGIVTETDLLELAAHALHERPPLAVGAITRRHLVTTRADRRLAQAEADMILRRVRHLPVIDEDGRLVGLISHRDVLRWRASVLESGASFEPELRVADTMTRDVVTVTPATTAEEAARTMLRHRFGCTPIVDGGRLVGIVTATDFIERLATPDAGQALQVRAYMRWPACTVGPGESVERAAELLGADDTACLVVIEDDRVAGLLTRTDLIDDARAPGRTLLPRDRSLVGEHMTRGVVEVAASAPVVDAFRLMLEREVHQVVVVEEGDPQPVGVLSRRDAIAAVRDLGLEAPLGAITTAISFTVGSQEPVRTARSLLEAADVSTILVTDGRFPVGVFGKREAIRARDAAPASAVGLAMDRALVVLPADLPLHHAAAQMLATGAHLAVVLRAGLQAGVVTATDFAEALARRPA